MIIHITHVYSVLRKSSVIRSAQPMDGSFGGVYVSDDNLGHVSISPSSKRY